MKQIIKSNVQTFSLYLAQSGKMQLKVIPFTVKKTYIQKGMKSKLRISRKNCVFQFAFNFSFRIIEFRFLKFLVTSYRFANIVEHLNF